MLYCLSYVPSHDDDDDDNDDSGDDDEAPMRQRRQSDASCRAMVTSEVVMHQSTPTTQSTGYSNLSFQEII